MYHNGLALWRLGGGKVLLGARVGWGVVYGVGWGDVRCVYYV